MEKKNVFLKLIDVCRTCLSSDSTLCSIFDNENVIITMLNNVLGTKLNKENYNKDMPSKICESCLRKLNSSYQFKQQCRDADMKIEKILSCFKESDKSSEHACLFKKLDSNGQYLAVDQDEYKNERLFEEKSDQDELAGLYDNLYQEENKDSIDIPEFKDATNEEKDNIFKVDIKSEPNLSPETEQNSHSVILGTEFNNLKAKSNIKKNKSKSNKNFSKRKSVSSKQTSQSKRKPNESNVSTLEENEQTHISKGKVSVLCKQCGKKFSNRNNLIRHERIHTGERPFICNICPKSYNQSNTLKAHMLSHNETVSFECNMCHKDFRRPLALKNHQRKYHATMLKTSHQCTICLKSFSSHLGLNAHVRVHSEDSSFECTKCQIKFSSRHFLTEHNLLRHNENGSPDTDVTKRGKKLPGLSNRLSDQQLHDNNSGSYLCNFCGKNCQTKFYFTIHLRRHTGERPFSCKHCSKKFISKAALDIHTNATHNDIRRYTCDVCGRKFRQACHLLVHKRIHNDERPFGCEFCSKRFRIKVSADIHLRIHTGEKPHKCDNCMQTFSDPSSYRKHSQKCKISKQELNEANE